jgi:hypothetical protein
MVTRNWQTSAERAAVIFYGLVLLAISALTGALWRYVAAHRDRVRACDRAGINP